jgi:hypothetical protein
MAVNVNDFISSLTAADARSGQNKHVKTNKQTTGKTALSGNVSLLTFKANDDVGVLDQIKRITEKGTLVDYVKVVLDVPYENAFGVPINYMWFKSLDLSFSDGPDVDVKPKTQDTNNSDLAAIYCTTTGGTNVRSTPTTVGKNIVRVVPLGDLVGYTDFAEKKYLTLTFIKVYTSKGVFRGWVSQKNVSTKKPPAQGLPKGGTTGVTDGEDPQSGNNDSGLGIGTIAMYVGIGLVVAWGAIVGLTFYKRRKEVKDGRLKK